MVYHGSGSPGKTSFCIGEGSPLNLPVMNRKDGAGHLLLQRFYLHWDIGDRYLRRLTFLQGQKMAKRDYENEPDDADELRGEEKRKRERHIEGPDCECWECMKDEEESGD